eukprot:355915-Chlamydomonas_euryale.AAC.8
MPCVAHKKLSPLPAAVYSVCHGNIPCWLGHDLARTRNVLPHGRGGTNVLDEIEWLMDSQRVMSDAHSRTKDQPGSSTARHSHFGVHAQRSRLSAECAA